MTAINQKEYLKKYLSGNKDKKKKRKKKAPVADRVKIIDDDIDISNLTSLQEAADLFNTNEDAPQVVGVIDERPMHLRIDDYRKSDLWRPIGIPDEDSGAQSYTVRQQNDLSPPRQKNKQEKKDRNKDNSPERKRNKRDYRSSSSQKYSDNSPPRKGPKSSPRRDRRNVVESPRRIKREKLGTPPQRSDNVNVTPPRRSKRDSDYSPLRKKHVDNSPLPRSSVRKKSRWDADDTPPRREHSSENKRNDSDGNSPPRKKHVDNSPPRRPQKSDDGPPRRGRNVDNISPRRNQRESDNSPIRRERYVDNSPPRRNKSDSDNSPPRISDKRRDIDNSPPRRNRRGSDNSPPRKGQDTDNSPPRRNRKNEDNSPPRKHRRDLDNSPPRKLPRKETESSPKPSSSKTVQEPPQRKLLPGNKKGKYLIPAKRADFNAQKMTKTLDGKSAGLQNKEELVKENEAFVRRENEVFKNMSSDISGANAAPIMRDRKTGKIRDLQKEAEERKEKEKREEENKEKYTRWGRGLKQVGDYEDKLAEDLHEMSKPLARYADDEDLERFLKEQEREGDPMLAYIRKKKKKKIVESGKPLKPQYEGEFMPNRFGIVPGYRWDGVDRSNGYEKKWFQVQNAKRAEQEEIYKWSTEDM